MFFGWEVGYFALTNEWWIRPKDCIWRFHVNCTSRPPFYLCSYLMLLYVSSLPSRSDWSLRKSCQSPEPERWTTCPRPNCALKDRGLTLNLDKHSVNVLCPVRIERMSSSPSWQLSWGQQQAVWCVLSWCVTTANELSFTVEPSSTLSLTSGKHWLSDNLSFWNFCTLSRHRCDWRINQTDANLLLLHSCRQMKHFYGRPYCTLYCVSGKLTLM